MGHGGGVRCIESLSALPVLLYLRVYIFIFISPIDSINLRERNNRNKINKIKKITKPTVEKRRKI